MPKLTHPLTKRIVDQLAPAEKDIFAWEGGDGAVKGLGCKVTPAGRKVFVFQYDDAGGRSRRITLGTFGAITVEQARAQARQHAAGAAAARNDPKALDPVRAREAARANAQAAAAAPTVAELFDRFLADCERRRVKDTTLAEYRRVLGVTEVRLGPDKGSPRVGVLRAALGAKRVSDVARRDVKTLHNAHSATPTMANRYVTLLSSVFAFAKAEELREPHSNPCEHVKRYKLTPKRQLLRDEEYRALGAALAAAATTGLPSSPARQARSRGMSAARRASLTGRTRGPYVRAAERAATPQNPVAVAVLRFLALSGWRSSEATGLRWDELDISRSAATLADTKTGRSARPLGTAALGVLIDLRGREDYPANTPYVFPGADPARPLTEVDHVWDAVRHAAGLKITLHGLRHAYTTTARYLGYGDHVIAQLVGHVLSATQTSRYGSVHELQVREAAERVAREIAGMLDAPCPATRVPGLLKDSPGP